MGVAVSLRVGENVGLSVRGGPVGDCVIVASIGTPVGNGSFDGVAVGEKVGAIVDGALEGLDDGSEFWNEVGKLDGPLVGC